MSFALLRHHRLCMELGLMIMMENERGEGQGQAGEATTPIQRAASHCGEGVHAIMKTKIQHFRLDEVEALPGLVMSITGIY